MTHPAFITLEGGEGTGKSLQSHLLAVSLTEAGQAVTRTREPGGSAGAERVRELLVSPDMPDWPSLSELFLFAAARADHLTRTVEPALAVGSWVVCDRFMDSTRVYQGYGRDVPRDTIDAVEAICPGPRRPDLTLVLDIPVETARARLQSRGGGDHYDRADPAFHERLRAGFRALTEKEPQRCVLVDADASADAVAQRIREIVAARLGSRLPGTLAPPVGSA